MKIEVTEGTINVERTGEAFSMNAHQYLITYPNGVTEFIWSPVWNDFTPEEEDAGACEFARKKWANGLQPTEYYHRVEGYDERE